MEVNRMRKFHSNDSRIIWNMCRGLQIREKKIHNLAPLTNIKIVSIFLPFSARNVNIRNCFAAKIFSLSKIAVNGI